MTARLQSDIIALLSDPAFQLEESELVDENSTDADPDISAVLLESIKKAQETNDFEFTPEDNAFADACLTVDSDNDWEVMKSALLDALNTPTSGLLQSSDSDLDEEMGMAREDDGEPAAEEEEVESREGIFGIWNLDIEESSDEELGLIKDLEEVLRKYSDTSTGTSTDAGTAEEEMLNSDLGGQSNVEELVADMGNLSLNPVDVWDDKTFN